MNKQEKKDCILNYTKTDLLDALQDLSIKPFVIDQIFGWIYQKKQTQFDQFHNIPKAVRENLAKRFVILPFKHIEPLASKDGSAVKCILDLEDNLKLEMVVLKEKQYNTLCVSSQVGCPVDCKFCVTGAMGFKRQLSVAEIVGQVLAAESLGYPIKNLVFMGMGEPLLNYENLFEALDMLTDENKLNIGKRRITVSTSGHIKLLERLINEERYLNLAFSVGCVEPRVRQRIMPLEKQNPICQVAGTLKKYLALHNRKLTLEYTLLEGVNDHPQHIKGLANLSQYLDAKINLINLNPHEKIPYAPVSAKALKAMQSKLMALGASVTVRYKKGQDISAACGQLGESMTEASI